MMRICKPQQGMALLFAVLIVALVATMVGAMSWRYHLQLEQAQNQRDRATILAQKNGAIFLGKVLLRQKLHRSDSTDNPKSELWTAPIPPQKPEGGGALHFERYVVQDCLNLNNLALGGVSSGDAILPLSRVSQAAYGRILAANRLPASLQATLLDWLDSDSEPLPEGAEDSHYIKKNPPYRPANNPLTSMSELLQVEGYNAEIIDTLTKAGVCVLQTPNVGEGTSININFVKPELLQHLWEGMDLANAKAFVQKRDAQGYLKTIDEALPLLPKAVSDYLNNNESEKDTFRKLLNVQTQFVGLRVIATYEESVVDYNALFYYNRTGLPQVVWQTY